MLQTERVDGRPVFCRSCGAGLPVGRQNKGVALAVAEDAIPRLTKFGRDWHLVGTAALILLAENRGVPSVTVGSVGHDFMELHIHIPARNQPRAASERRRIKSSESSEAA